MKKQKHTRTKGEFREDWITETKDFAGKIIKDENGKQRLQILSTMWYQQQINKFKVGENVSLYISSRRPKRSAQQNRYLFGVYYPLIATETGNRNIHALHKHFAEMFLVTSEEVAFGKSYKVIKSSALLSKSEFSTFIMDIEAETGIEAPPTLNYFDDK